MKAVQKCFVAVAFFLLSSTQFTAFAADFASDNQDQPELHAAESTVHFNPFHLPTYPKSSLPDTEVPDQNEAEEESGFDEEGDLFRHLAFNGNDTFGSSGHLGLPFLRTLQNRPSISLVILHHSWKSFFA